MTVKRIIASLAAVFTLGILPASAIIGTATAASATPVAAAPSTFYHG